MEEERWRGTQTGEEEKTIWGYDEEKEMEG